MSLLHLLVRNLGVLDNASIDPSPGLTVITGETGAGKTLLLGGVRLILGAKADSAAVGPHDDAARVNALFDRDGVEIGVSRTVPRDGRSRGYIDGAIVSVGALAEQLGSVVEVVGQHDQVALARPSRILEMIDGSLDEGGVEARHGYVEAWEALRAARERQARLGGDQTELARELDLARYQASEIDKAGLSPELDEELEGEASRLRNVTEIGDHLSEINHLAEDMSESVGEVVARLRKAAGLDPGLDQLTREGDALAAGVADLARATRSAFETLESDPQRLAELEERLTAIGDLKHKYGRTLEEVISYGERTAQRVSELEELLEEADEIDGIVVSSTAAVAQQGRLLTTAREAAAKRLAGDALTHLGDLGLAKATLRIELEEVDPGPSGADRALLSFASDSRLEPGPVSSVASGGELSRLVLALSLAAAGSETVTLVFDEVDTGIGGQTALAMGQKLAELAAGFQVLCVTHLPQVAAHADRHYVVERTTDGTARARQVSGEDRLVELSRMLAGQPESETGKLAAAELLELVGR
jgi:DNA repair protein RecN (Recombination protein N)